MIDFKSERSWQKWKREKKGKSWSFSPSWTKCRKTGYEICVSLKAEVLAGGGDQRYRDSCPTSHCSQEADNLSILHSHIQVTLAQQGGWMERESEFRCPESPLDPM